MREDTWGQLEAKGGGCPGLEMARASGTQTLERGWGRARALKRSGGKPGPATWFEADAGEAGAEDDLRASSQNTGGGDVSSQGQGQAAGQGLRRLQQVTLRCTEGCSGSSVTMCNGGFKA